ncbi:NanQ anomerase/TabA/YiaL family protein [Lacticaseibacillus sp. GG6-2]
MFVFNLNAPHLNLIHSTGLGKVLSYLQTTDLVALKPGRGSVAPDIPVTIQEYTTRTEAEGKYENHRDEVDIQLIVEGEELVQVTNTAGLTQKEDDFAAHDIAFYADPTTTPQNLILRAGDIVVLFPEDAHKPCLDTDGKHDVKKLIFKVPLAQF